MVSEQQQQQPPPSPPSQQPQPNNDNESTAQQFTRLCLKHLPPSITEESQITQHLLSSSSKQEIIITDCKIMKTKHGKSRKMAFVGFKTPEMASFVLHHFHGTYIRTSKIIVERAFPKGESSEHRPWSKYSVGSSLSSHRHHDSQNENDNKDETQNENDNDDNKQPTKTEDETLKRKKEEFMSAMGVVSKNKKAKFWSNDDGFLLSQQEQQNEQEKKKKKKEVADEEKEEKNKKSEKKKKKKKKEEEEEEAAAEEEEKKEKTKKSSKPDTKNVMSDLDFLKSKQTQKDTLVSDDEEEHDKADLLSSSSSSSAESSSSSAESSSSSSSSTSSDDDDDDDNSQTNDHPHKTQDETTTTTKKTTSSSKEDEISPTRLFVRNLPFQTTEEELQSLFESYGTITECHIPLDDVKKSKGYGFVRFETSEEANKAKQMLDQQEFQGRLLHVLPGKKGGEEEGDDEGEVSERC